MNPGREPGRVTADTFGARHSVTYSAFIGTCNVTLCAAGAFLDCNVTCNAM
jgi:hypothetical protein